MRFLTPEGVRNDKAKMEKTEGAASRALYLTLKTVVIPSGARNLKKLKQASCSFVSANLFVLNVLFDDTEPIFNRFVFVEVRFQRVLDGVEHHFVRPGGRVFHRDSLIF